MGFIDFSRTHEHDSYNMALWSPYNSEIEIYFLHCSLSHSVTLIGGWEGDLVTDQCRFRCPFNFRYNKVKIPVTRLHFEAW